MAKKSRKDQSSPKQPAESPIVIKGGFEWIPSRDQPVEFSEEFWSQCKVILHFAERLRERLGKYRDVNQTSPKIIIPKSGALRIAGAANNLETSIFLMPRPDSLVLRGLRTDLSRDEQLLNIENIQYHRDKLTGSREASDELSQEPWVDVFHELWDLVVLLQDRLRTPTKRYVNVSANLLSRLEANVKDLRLLTVLPGEHPEPQSDTNDTASLAVDRQAEPRPVTYAKRPHDQPEPGVKLIAQQQKIFDYLARRIGHPVPWDNLPGDAFRERNNAQDEARQKALKRLRHALSHSEPIRFEITISKLNRTATLREIKEDKKRD